MGLSTLYESSHRFCLSTEEYREATRDFNNKCSNHQPHRFLITCNYCQKDFKTIDNREVRCSSCCCLIEQKLKTYTFEKLKMLASVYNIKRRKQEFIIEDLVQKVENYII